MFKPKRYKYEPMSIRRQRELARFDTIRDQISPLVAEGSPLSLLKAQQALRQSNIDKQKQAVQKKNWMHKVGESVRKRLEVEREGPQPGVPRGVAEAFPELAEGKRVYDSSTTEPLRGIGTHLDRPRGAVAGAAKNPSDPVRGAIEGFKRPEENKFRDVGPFRRLPDEDLTANFGIGGESIAGRLGLSARDIAGGVADIAADPLNLVGGGAIKALKGARSATGLVDEADPIANRVREAVQRKFKPGMVPQSGGASMMGATLKTQGAVPLGDNGIQEALSRKAQGLNQPENPVTYGPQGSKRRAVVGSVFNPSANMPREVHVANNARIGVQNMLYTDFFRSEQQAARAVKDAFAKSPPTYIGTERSAAVGTPVDFLERPSQYTDVSPELEAAKDAWGQAQLDNLNRVRAEYRAEIDPYMPTDPRGVYVPHVHAKDDLDQRVQATSQSLASRTSLSKSRAYPTLHERLKNRQDFTPELDLEKLADTHANSLAFMAGNNTFKDGVGGLTRREALEQFHPNLVKQWDETQELIVKLRNRLKTAERRAGINVGKADELDNALEEMQRAQPVGGARPLSRIPTAMRKLDDRAERLAGPKGDPWPGGRPATRGESMKSVGIKAALAKLDQLVPDETERIRFLDTAINRTDRRINVLEQRGGRYSQLASGLRSALDDAKDRLDRLRPAWETADTGDLVLSNKTFRYHPPEQARAIDSVLKTKLDNAFLEGVLQGADEARIFQLGPDFSPLTIQGVLGAMSHPEVLVRDSAVMAKIAFRGDEALMQAVKPDVVRRYEFATGRSFGNVGQEFRQKGRGLERIPVAGRGIGAFNDAMQRMVEYGNLKAWENDTRILQAFGVPENIADHEAANSLSKFLPRLNPAETGRSVQRARLERIPFISSSFRYAPPLIAKDITTAASNLAINSVKHAGNPKAAWQSLDGREQLALLRGSIFASTWMGMSIASALASAESKNLDPVEAIKEVINPVSGKFGNVIIGDKGSIGLGGPMRTFIRAMAPAYVDGKLVPFARTHTYLTSSMPSAIKYPYDLIRNEDYFGNKIVEGDFPENFGRALLYGLESANIIGGAAIEPMRTGVGNPLTNVASQVVGTNYNEPSPTDRLNEIARGLPENKDGKGFYDLDPDQQDKIKKANPDLWNAAVDRGSEERKKGEAVKSEYRSRQEARDQALLGGSIKRDEWVNAYYDDLTAKAAEMKQIYGDRPIDKPKNPREKYIKILQEAEDPATGILERDKVDAGMASLTETDRAYIDRTVGLDDTPIAQVFRDMREVRRGRAELPKYRGFTADQAEDIDEVWQEVRNNARSADRVDMLRALRMYLASNSGLDGAVVAGVRKRINGRLRQVKAREMFDRAHPEMRIFYGNGKLTESEIEYLTSEMNKKDAA